MGRSGSALLAAMLLIGAAPAPKRDAAGFPVPQRPVAGIVSDVWWNEADRRKAGEAESVIRATGVTEGMTVADIGAGEGYYAVSLAKAVGPKGRVFAEDVMPDYVEALRRRVQREDIANVDVVLGTPDDAKLPTGRFDRIFLIHMYHEIEDPYALLWRLRGALKPGGRIVIVDLDAPTQRHGTPPRLLTCELAAVGLRQTGFKGDLKPRGYLAEFTPAGEPPRPAEIRPCRG